MAKKNMFTRLFAATAEVIKMAQMPSRIKMLKRAAERVGDELESKRIASDFKLQELYHKLINCDNEDVAGRLYREIALVTIELEDATELAARVAKIQENIFIEEEEVTPATI